MDHYQLLNFITYYIFIFIEILMLVDVKRHKLESDVKGPLPGLLWFSILGEIREGKFED